MKIYSRLKSLFAHFSANSSQMTPVYLHLFSCEIGICCKR